MTLFSFKYKDEKITAGEMPSFLQSKYNYYKNFSFWVVILAILSSTTYFVSDCQIFGYFQTYTLVPRFISLLMIPFFIIAYRKITSYRCMSIINNICVHMVMLNTVWAICYLPDRSHVSEGFLIMQSMFFAISFASPFSHTIISFLVFFLGDIMISNLFIHYEDLSFIISLGMPLAFGICASALFMQKLYVGHYKIEEKMKRQSLVDSLTGLYNRRYIKNSIEPEKLKLFENESCVCIFDIDFFKKVNDKYGHEAGDHILQHISKLTKSVIREKDIAIRWGGEEFVVLMPDTAVSEAMAITEALRSTIENTDSDVCKVTISAGVSKIIDYDIQKSVNAADEALYKAKESGRNNVKFK